jgi:hypothetical protein
VGNAPLPVPQQRNEGPEQAYSRTLGASGYTVPAAELIDTLAFFRHRRNALVHLSATPSASYLALAQQRGGALNGFWTRANVQIDFREATAAPLTERDTLDALKLLRILVQRLDAHFVSTLDARGVARIEAVQAFGDKRVRLNVQVVESRVKTLHGIIRRDYGLNIRAVDLAAAVRAANPRV